MDWFLGRFYDETKGSQLILIHCIKGLSFGLIWIPSGTEYWEIRPVYGQGFDDSLRDWLEANF